jgi:hemoglobin
MKSWTRAVGLLATTAGLFTVLAAGGCESGGKMPGGGSGNAPTKATDPLYFRLGGYPAIEAVCGDLVDRLARNPKIDLQRRSSAHPWDPTPANVEKLKQLLTDFVCNATGGPQKYTGRDMVTAHKCMKFTEAEFNASAEDLAASLDKFNVQKREKDELMALVGTLKGQIVGQ